ncbi:hypothetical protein C1645_818487 [Glomus cerebriforme]|uniref:Uncharacterized protein n=1 Tax=Glomus cerebriforme TaxID=658196 RepID=A0A397TGI5_9GLOM|nr:hypothetical protein C1645_818487 [Glomus cerebriforme]
MSSNETSSLTASSINEEALMEINRAKEEIIHNEANDNEKNMSYDKYIEKCEIASAEKC